jgi:hypothetical protein
MSAHVAHVHVRLDLGCILKMRCTILMIGESLQLALDCAGLGCWPRLQGLIGEAVGYYDLGSMPGCMMQLAHHSNNIRRLDRAQL